ncbi:signal recognition particle protein [Alienimonas sp. DA493]|uniref:signal recognition particle protein n=1 Tax=Alienimonas sp. DA493 TaxID=3373605 RepID=UPI0037550F38
MFESFSERLQKAMSFIDRGRLTEATVREGMRQVRQALLEADVAYDVARDFTKRVSEQAVGDRVLKSLKPSEQIVGIVYRELVVLMGGDPDSDFKPSSPAAQIGVKRDGVTVLMMCGLQGAGKTTTCGKLARALKKGGFAPMLVAADLQRPAAIEQLKTLGEQVGVPVYTEDPANSTPVKVCQNGVKEAKRNGETRVVILDTAGRLGVDEELMRELSAIDRKVGPDAAFLVADAMTGQDAVNSAKAFNEALELDGVVLTKMDGDTRGGAALSIKAVTGVPLKFVGTGETLDGLEAFHPDRMAGRILGGGDMATLLEKAQREFDADEMAEQQARMAEGKFTLLDFQKAMRQISKLGSMRSVMKMIPGMGQLAEMDPSADMDREVGRVNAMIGSMTQEERLNPDRIDRSRRNRIAAGSGVQPHEVHKLLKDFKGMSGMMQNMAGLGMRDRMAAVKGLAGQMSANPGGQLQTRKQSTKADTDLAKLRAERKRKKKLAKKSRKKNR